MKLGWNQKKTAAFTLVELVVIIAVVAVLVAFVLPALEAAKKKGQKISCVNNLMQIGLSFRLWEDEHTNLYPMAVSIANGGTMGMMTNQVAGTFLALSNQLCTPYILFCPADDKHIRAESFNGSVGNSNISYFIGLDATDKDPQAFLSGDDNFEIKGVAVQSGLLEVYSNTPIGWTDKRHVLTGNIALADGSVHSANNPFLTHLVQQTGLGTNRLVIP